MPKQEVRNLADTPLPPAGTGETSALAEYRSQDELAEELNTTKRTLARWRASRTGPPYVIISRRILYRRRATADWLLKRERGFEESEKVAPGRRARR
jgi:hypothetical protein